MAFLCPICRTTTMVPAQLEPDLPVDQCSTCRGQWITSGRYFGFATSAVAPTSAPGAVVKPGKDSAALKLCPACGKFMHYYPVGHGLVFGIDKCNTCGGVWLNAGEWEALKAQGLHLKVHAISSDVWQAAVAREHREQLEEAALAQRLGPGDYAELQRVAAWVGGHAHQAEILAYLQHGAGRGMQKDEG